MDKCTYDIMTRHEALRPNICMLYPKINLVSLFPKMSRGEKARIEILTKQSKVEFS